MKNKKVFRFIRFLKENKASVLFKKNYYSDKSIRFRKQRFELRFDAEDTSKMTLFEFLRYANEKEIFPFAFDFLSAKPSITFWCKLESLWRYKHY